MDNNKKILMVCLGNICRSPLAEGIMQKLSNDKKLNWKVDSAGTGGWHVGESPHVGSINIAKKHGIDISKQKARQFNKRDFDVFDEIYVMDEENYKDIIRLTTNEIQAKKVKYLLSAANMMEQNVPDPYYTNKFEDTYNLIFSACKTIISSKTALN
jgi:protein-tyrosine phosphatase